MEKKEAIFAELIITFFCLEKLLAENLIAHISENIIKTERISLTKNSTCTQLKKRKPETLKKGNV